MLFSAAPRGQYHNCPEDNSDAGMQLRLVKENGEGMLYG